MALVRHDSPVRVLAAGLCVMGGLGSLVSAFLDGYWFGLAIAPLFFALVFVLKERDWWMIVRGMSPEARFAELERRGEITHETVRARRALHLFDYSTGCDVYLIDCEDGRLLCLYGQYFYDWEPIEEEQGFVKGRGFPTREFVITRRAPDQDAYTLVPGRKVIHPEITDGEVTPFHAAKVPLSDSDGVYLTLTYDEAKAMAQQGALPNA